MYNQPENQFEAEMEAEFERDEWLEECEMQEQDEWDARVDEDDEDYEYDGNPNHLDNRDMDEDWQDDDG